MGNTKRPASSVTAVRTLPCVRLVSVTVDAGSTPPCESWTDPVTDALVVCASKAAADYPQDIKAKRLDAAHLSLLRRTWNLPRIVIPGFQ